MEAAAAAAHGYIGIGAARSVWEATLFWALAWVPTWFASFQARDVNQVTWWVALGYLAGALAGWRAWGKRLFVHNWASTVPYAFLVLACGVYFLLSDVVTDQWSFFVDWMGDDAATVSVFVLTTALVLFEVSRLNLFRARGTAIWAGLTLVHGPAMEAGWWGFAAAVVGHSLVAGLAPDWRYLILPGYWVLVGPLVSLLVEDQVWALAATLLAALVAAAALSIGLPRAPDAPAQSSDTSGLLARSTGRAPVPP